MHRLFSIEEIRHEIFDSCFQYSDRPNEILNVPQGRSDLVALARTCKAFKEPALDVLWSYLTDLTPLVRCLPGISYQTSNGEYALKRPLNKADWDVIFSFTRRVRICYLYYLYAMSSSRGLTAECLEDLSKPPLSISSLFPNLCKLDMKPEEKHAPFFRHFAVPALTSVGLSNSDPVQHLADAIAVFGERCPRIRTFEYQMRFQAGLESISDTISGLVCQLPDLRIVSYGYMRLSPAAFVHLSRASNLYDLELELTNPDAIIDHIRSISPGSFRLTFPSLVHTAITSPSSAVLSLFSHLSLPAIMGIDVTTDGLPTALELMSFISALQNTGAQSLEAIILFSSACFTDDLPYHINFRHLRPLTAFTNITKIDLSIDRGVDLSESELLELASSWPNLQLFIIGNSEGCTPSSAITPGGFVTLLDRCRLLRHFSFMFDTRGYTGIPQGHPWNGLEMDPDSWIDVRYSPIEEESIEAFAVFFHVGPFPDFHIRFGLEESGLSEEVPEHLKVYHDRWVRVADRAEELWEEEEDS